MDTIDGHEAGENFVLISDIPPARWACATGRLVTADDQAYATKSKLTQVSGVYEPNSVTNMFMSKSLLHAAYILSSPLIVDLSVPKAKVFIN